MATVLDYEALVTAVAEVLGACEDFRPRIPPVAIRAGHRLVADLGVDSVALLDLALGLEARLGRPVDEADLAVLETVGDVARHLEGR
ncbi:MAG: acyl carrier protein [Candidatus Sericytochromatia bacterium]|nr:acyl carrier protein [Candidatus Tanganyikabacteria bacterium]